MTLVGPRRRAGDYPLNETELAQKWAAGTPRPGEDLNIMTPAEEAEFVRKMQYLAGKPTPQEIEASLAERDRQAREAEAAVLKERDELMAERARVREEEWQDHILRERRAEETFVNQQLASQAHYEAKVLEQITEEERARREATLLSDQEVHQANVDAQKREEKTKEELAARTREEYGEQDIEQFQRLGFGFEKTDPMSDAFEPWGGAQGTEEAYAEDVQGWERAKALGFAPGPKTGEMPRPQTRSASLMPGDIVDTFA
jgi:hypothetical protein